MPTMPLIRTIAAFAITLSIPGSALAQQKAASKMLPYTTVDHPQFVAASQASFLSDDDLVIGVSAHGVTKAYPAADLAQHGDVQDQMPDGPIAVTW
jgi:DNA-binding MurR/RpiR family transcriptional regulator